LHETRPRNPVIKYHLLKIARYKNKFPFALKFVNTIADCAAHPKVAVLLDLLEEKLAVAVVGVTLD